MGTHGVDLVTVAPAMFFDCPRLRMRLSEAGCARMFRSTLDSRPEPHEGRYGCIACPIGARNAGINISPIASIVESLRNLCPRCTRPAERLINGDLCVSCYNREREARIGRNAKGNAPLITAQLRPAALYVVGDTSMALVRRDSVLCLREVVIHVAKNAAGPLAISRPVRRPLTPQAAIDLIFVPRRVRVTPRSVRLPPLPPRAAPMQVQSIGPGGRMRSPESRLTA